jgi:hypothetical protein
MPTVMLINGWRFYFYANERNEPIHIHCRKGDKECKYWLNRKDFSVAEAYAYRMTGGDRREVKRTIFEFFEQIEKEWDKFHPQ